MDLFEKTANRLLVDTFNYLLRYEEKKLQTMTDVPITIGEAHLIENIGKFENSVNVSDIAAAISISVPTATVGIKKLVEKGFATKELCKEDNRRQKVSLTEKGKEIAARHENFHLKMIEDVSEGLSDDEKKVLIAALNKLMLFFKEKAEKK